MKPFLFPEGATFGTDHVVLHASARRHVVDGIAGPLSIKTVLRGVVRWTVEGRELEVDRGSFLVLGEGERYSMNIDERRPVETCCVFFRRGFVERMALDATTTLAAALDDPMREGPALGWVARIHADDASDGMRAQVQTLAPRCRSGLNPSGFEEDFAGLGERLLALHAETARQLARIPAAKPATRAELFRRLEVAREFLHARLEGPVSLDETARAAMLSSYHFHRTFREVYQTTPHQYLTWLRLNRARTLIETGMPVLAAGVAVGFSSPSSFARLFRARLGLAPSQIRKNGQDRPGGTG